MKGSSIIALALFVLALGGSIGLRVGLVDALGHQRKELSLDEDLLKSPGPEVLQAAALGHNLAWADVVWLGIVQELGSSGERTEPSYDRIQRWAHIATDLDPQYYNAYYASAIHLIAYAKRALAAEELLLKGMRHIKDRWQLPFYLGYNSYFLKGDAKEAQQYWKMALPMPEVPRFIPSLIARARAQQGDIKSSIQSAIGLLETMLPSLEGPQREDAEIRIKLLKSEFILYQYDEACVRWAQEKGIRPTPKDIFEAGLVQHPPKDLLDKDIYFDARCRARTELIKVREDEARERIGSQAKDVKGFVDPSNRVNGQGADPDIEIKSN